MTTRRTFLQLTASAIATPPMPRPATSGPILMPRFVSSIRIATIQTTTTPTKRRMLRLAAPSAPVPAWLRRMSIVWRTALVSHSATCHHKITSMAVSSVFSSFGGMSSQRSAR